MRAPDGQEFPLRGEFVEVVERERLVFTAVAEAADGNTLLRSHTTVSFADEQGATRLTVEATAEALADSAYLMLDGMREGWEQTLVRLASLVSVINNRELVFTRVINAPPERVFAAWKDPELLKQWWGTADMTTPSCEIDFRPGGAFRALMRTSDGADYPMRGVFLQIEEPSLIVFTDGYEEGWIPTPDPFITAFFHFEPLEGRTRLVARVLHWSAAERKRHEDMGFAVGWGGSVDKLARLVESSGHWAG
jgi:uncharacterized protein YndB with AHSA1/START domain